MGQTLDAIAIRVFVDSTWPQRFWGCHHLPERSFFVQGRQFHVCARCTGLVTGLAAGIPAALVLFAQSFVAILFSVFFLALIVDGLTQLCGWRTSNNTLRFATGFGTAATCLPAFVNLIGGS